MEKLHIDIETYSSVDLKTSGIYKYVESIDFEILIVAFALNNAPVTVVDLASGEQLPDHFIMKLLDVSIEKHAHNAAFERLCFAAIGLGTRARDWHCSANKASYCGLPRSLEDVSTALKLGDKAKDNSGKALIRFFSMPCKPTKKNGMRKRNFPHHDPEKWAAYKEYCKQDVVAERAIEDLLIRYEMPSFERDLYALDQEINDRGVKIDLPLVRSAIKLDGINAGRIMARMKEISGLENPNSVAQLKTWFTAKIGRQVESLTKGAYPGLIEESSRLPDPEVAEEVVEMIELRQEASKSAIKKYTAMLKCACRDGRARGLFQYYGANRTGRWAGRLIQLQNLFRNKLKGEALDRMREAVLKGNFELVKMMYGDVSNTLAQLVRTALVAIPGQVLAVADFSAIEARVIAWLAGEEWRIELFRKGGDIYVQSYSQMMNIDADKVDDDARQKGKIAELACGYQGSVGALKQMGGESMGLSEGEMRLIVNRWRSSNPSIQKFWQQLESAAIESIHSKTKVVVNEYVSINTDDYGMRMMLPSGRELFYKGARLENGPYGPKIKYEGVDQDTKRWGWLDTYGGKLAENCTQAVARDLLAFSMVNMWHEGFEMNMHVHDEAIAEVPEESGPDMLQEMYRVMGSAPDWAEGLPLNADGYITKYYKKD